jgi:hypothetical protein
VRRTATAVRTPTPPLTATIDIRTAAAEEQQKEAVQGEAWKEAIQAGQAFVPEVWYNGLYYPICGNCFWDNNEGATAVCKDLGFTSGEISVRFNSPGLGFSKDAMPVGSCNPGETLDKCSGGCHNGWGNFEQSGGWCKQGKTVGVAVTCTGIAGVILMA